LALAAFSLPFLLDGHRPSPTEATPSAIQGTAALRQRAVRDPQDPRARLELASAYLQSGDVPAATRAYVDVLRVDPSNPEAHTQLGWILLGAGRPTEALVEENRALSARPAYPEALYVRGLVLLRGLHRPPRAADSFRDYLAAAPFGSHRSQVLALLRSIRARAGAGGA
jgi:Tfp pilus assembly protein PilF